MKKVLVVLTNTIEYKGTDQATGLWLGEATEFVDEVTKAGFDFDYVTNKGAFVPLDPRSFKYTDKSTMAIYSSSDFQQRALTNSLKPSEVHPEDYQSIYYTGGHWVMGEFPTNPELQSITRKIYQQGGFVTSVCHGIAGLLNVKDDDGNYLISDKKITGFTTAENILAGKRKDVPFHKHLYGTNEYVNFQKKRAYKEFAIQDGQLITGQNPFSARAVARILIENN
ncbi:type 1 glutamine amidotransferase domain-containing protein [Companilactobacillus bobalius]|uniref:type 1 glutamine amidotransferase domain-containing protein n=1 Tax=Companilactobacillus bobalius TaxID=2801451 RepID=UPI0013026D13|nr:type 1 glutamine amidotransferase domain-containing protein [Companilactobacillus bobalius]KAE9560152.1 peptidase C56 [Companilactobacillus bobalius]